MLKVVATPPMSATDTVPVASGGGTAPCRPDEPGSTPGATAGPVRNHAGSAPLFSLVLATYGRSDVLGPMLDSLLAQSCRDFELIVVDQNPDDRVVPLLAPVSRAGIAVRHLRLGEPNLSAARNLGIEAARGTFVAFPDDDCWYEGDCLAAVAAASRAQPAVSGWIVRWVEALPDEGVARSADVTRAAFRAFRGGDASSISLFLATDAVRKLSGFDPRIGVGRYYGAGEETDLMIRVLDAGLAVRYLPGARVHHLFDSERPKLTRQRWQGVLRRERGVGALYVKHRLANAVIARGLLAPVWNGARSRRPVEGVLYGVAAVMGRVSGMLAWARRERAPQRTRPTGPDESRKS